MANLQGGVYITFNKPYLNMVANLIISNKSLIINKKTEVIKKTNEVKAFLKAVKETNEMTIKSLLTVKASQYSTIFNGYKWSDIDKSQFTKKSGSDAKTTRMQELASLFAIQKSIEKI